MKLSLFNTGENVFEACATTGSRVLITGSTGPDTQMSVSYECMVDYGLPSNTSVNGAVGNNLRLCEQDGLSDAPHVLTVNVQATDGTTFWIDYVKYLPTASTPGLENAAISIDSTDAGLNFVGWTSNFSASATGATLSFNFIGISQCSIRFSISPLIDRFEQEYPFYITRISIPRFPLTQAQKRPAIRLTVNLLFPSMFCPRLQNPVLMPLVPM